MAGAGVKRSASTAAGAAHKKAASGVAPKCRQVATAIREAEHVPSAVRSMLIDMLTRTFGTYKEERHPFQATVSDLVGKTLKESQQALEAAINEAQQKKAAIEEEARPLIQASEAATFASTAASEASSTSRTAMGDAKTALRDAKAALHELQSAEKNADSHSKGLAASKAALESLKSDVIAAVREGRLHGAPTGRQVGNTTGAAVEPEFRNCVVQTFSKKSADWGTFDKLVDRKLDEALDKALSGLAVDLQKAASEKEARTASIETQKATIATAEEGLKAAEEACTAAAAHATEAAAAAKAAAAACKSQQAGIQKATEACSHAEEALASFNSGPLAAYTEIEARTAPPEPEPIAEAMEEAMRPAPAMADPAATAPSSPRVLLNRAVSAVAGLASSPRVAA